MGGAFGEYLTHVPLMELENEFKEEKWVHECRGIPMSGLTINPCNKFYCYIVYKTVYKLIKEYKDVNVAALPRIPDGVFKDDFDTETALLTNAWDPWSFIGNGNFSDESLDGYFGRSTAMQILSWPIVNKEIKYIPVDLS